MHGTDRPFGHGVMLLIIFPVNFAREDQDLIAVIFLSDLLGG